MQFYNINNPKESVSARQAVLSGMATDGGLFMPAELPAFSQNFVTHLPTMDLQEITFEVTRHFFCPEIKRNILEEIVDSAIQFDAPLTSLGDGINVLELFHGPTLSFKDFGAQFMARLMSHFMAGMNQDLTILAATSGDTGGAVAHGFHRVDGVRVVLLYPSGKVSQIQEKQFTTLGDNIFPLQIDGTFDDCQRLVKHAFADAELGQALRFTAANSINIARLIAQIPYYFRAFGQMPAGVLTVDASVPCGNFGNLTAGVMAKLMGLPLNRIVAATNANDVVPRYLKTGQFRARKPVQTISNAMDVGNPSNFVRISALLGHSLDRLRKQLVGFSLGDDETIETIIQVFKTHGMILDPHGAVAYAGLQAYRQEYPDVSDSLFLATAHPAKFRETIAPLVGKHLVMPPSLEQSLKQQGNSVPLSSDFAEFKAHLLN